MTPPLLVGMVGANRHAAAVADQGAPLGGARVSAVAASPDGEDRKAAAVLGRRLRAAVAPSWEAVAQDPDVAVVLVAADGPQRESVCQAALSAGKVVVCPAPAAESLAALDRLAEAQARGGGTLLAPGEIRQTVAGAHAVRLAANGDLGEIHSVYAAVRFPASDRAAGRASVLETAAWDAFDAVCAAVPHPQRRVHATTARAFGHPADDAAVVIARFGDAIATIEVARCLPGSLATTVHGEVEIDIIGSREAIRVEPYRTAVHEYRGRAAARLAWADEPVLGMLDRALLIALGTIERPDDFAHARRVIALADAVRESAARQDTVAVS
jgi:predicted dehydrogenase